MPKHARTFATFAAAAAMLAIPAAGLAKKPTTNTHGKSQQAKANQCATAAKVKGLPFIVNGTLVSATADDAATAASEATVTIKVTSANRHATLSGEIADQNATKKGVQVKGATYTVAAGDAFAMKLDGYTAPDTPSAGDRVKVRGKMSLTRKSCAPAATSTADRYAAPDIRSVTVSDRDVD